MRYLKFVLAICAAVALLSGVVLAADTVVPPPPPPPAGPYVLEGVISAINFDRGSITVNPPPIAGLPPRPAFMFFISNQTIIVKNDQVATLRDLAIGDACRAEIQENLDGVPFAMNVRARSPQPQMRSVTGTIASINPTEMTFGLALKPEPSAAPVIIRFFVDKDTKIRRNGVVVGFGDLKVSDLASVSFAVLPNVQLPPVIRAAVVEAKSVVVPPPPTNTILEGVISAISLEKGAITLVAPPSAPARPAVTFFVNADTKIYKNGVIAPFGALAVGDICRAEVRTTTEGTFVALNVQAKSPIAPPPTIIVLEGTISAINLDRKSITLAPPSADTTRPAVAFYVNGDTKIYKNGVLAPLSALAVGDTCRAEVKALAEGALLAVNVQAKSLQPLMRTVTGAITNINLTEMTFGLTIKSEISATPVVMRFFVDKDTKIRRNGVVVGFGDLRVGDLASVSFAVLPNVALPPVIRAAIIEAKSAITPPPTNTILEGVIGAINLEKGAITLNPPPGVMRPTVIFYVNATTKIYKNGVLAPLSALAVGDTCRAEVRTTTEGTFVALNVQAKSPIAPPPTIIVLEGTISAINLDRKSVTLAPPATNPTKPAVTFYVNGDTKIYKNGVLVALSALAVKDVCRAEVKPTTEGSFVALSVRAISPLVTK